MTVRPDTKTGIIHKFKSSIFHLDKNFSNIVYLLWFGICLIRIFDSTQTILSCLIIEPWEHPFNLFSPLSFRLVFKDRQNAGQILNDKLKTLFKSGKIEGFNFDPGSILFFGIPRGGLIVAYEIAK